VKLTKKRWYDNSGQKLIVQVVIQLTGTLQLDTSDLLISLVFNITFDVNCELVTIY